MIYCFSCCGSLRLGVLEGSEGGKRKRVRSLQVWNIMPCLICSFFSLLSFYTFICTCYILNVARPMRDGKPVTLLSTCGVLEVNRRDKKKLRIIFQFKATINTFAGKCSTSPSDETVSCKNILDSIYKDESQWFVHWPQKGFRRN